MEREEAIYRNTSKMDAQEIALFQAFAMKRVNIWASILFAVIFVGIGIGVSFIELTFGIITIACGILGGFVLLPYLMKASVQKQNERNTDERKYLNTFDFFEEYVIVSTQSAMPNSNDYQEIASQKLFYTDIPQALLYKDHIFLYLSSNQAFIINYKGMTKGTISEVIEFLKSKNIKILDKSTK